MSNNHNPLGHKSGNRVDKRLARVMAENARRVPCPHCPVTCLPETLNRHVRLCHEDGE